MSVATAYIPYIDFTRWETSYSSRINLEQYVGTRIRIACRNSLSRRLVRESIVYSLDIVQM